MKAYFYIVIFLFLPASLSADIFIENNSVYFVTGNQIEAMEDPSGKLPIDSILKSSKFKTLDQPVPNFGLTKSTYWLKFTVSNFTDKNIYIELGNPLLNNIQVYSDSAGKPYSLGTYGNHYSFYQRFIPINTFLIDPSIAQGETKTLFIRLESIEPLETPIHIGSIESFYITHHKLNFLEGIYFGLLVLMLFYNLFLYFSVKDELYLYYVIYVLSLVLMMGHFKGYTFEYLWSNYPDTNKFFAVLYSFGCMSGIIFSVKFLKARIYNPVLFKLSYVFAFLFSIAIIISFFGYFHEANMIEMGTGMAGCLYLFILGIASYLKGNKTAKYYIVAFSSIIIGAIITTFYYLKIIPYNSFNANAVLIGSGLELLFLSLALADRINLYKAETAEAQKSMIEQLKENEKLKDEMNKELEKMVKERTKELNEKSEQVDLLVYKASHDIKGPLRSIVTLTKLGINDLKDNPTALSYLENINYASSKVSNMVTDILNLAKLKETNLIYEEIEPEGIVTDILKSLQNLPEYSRVNIDLKIKKGLKIVSDKKALFSILQNMLENGIKYSDSSKAKCYVKLSITQGPKNYLLICEDNGIGIPADKKDRIFEMFYKVNESSIGSGMGLYLVKETVHKLKGKIELTSEEGQGTTLILSLPVTEN